MFLKDDILWLYNLSFCIIIKKIKNIINVHEFFIKILIINVLFYSF